VCGRGCGGRDDEAGWLAGCHGGDGRAPSVRTRTLRELSLGRVSVGRVSAELTRWCITRKWCAGAQVAAGPALWAVSGLLFSWGGQRSLVLVGAEQRRRPADWGGRDDEAGWRRLGLGWVSALASHLLSSSFGDVPPRPRACTHPEVRRPQWKKSGGRLIGVLRRVNRLMRWE
jgi:hypothetical protein